MRRPSKAAKSDPSQELVTAGPAPAAPPASAADMLKNLAASKTPAAASAKGKKKAAPEIMVTDPAIAEQLDRAAAGKLVGDVIKGPVEGAKDLVKPWLVRKMVELWLQHGHRTDNPNFKTLVSSGTVQMKSVLRYDKSQENGTLVEQLAQAGVPEAARQALATKFRAVTKLGIVPFDKLIAGNEAEQAVASKLMGFIGGEQFSQEERDLLLTPVENVIEIEGDDFLNSLPSLPQVSVDTILRVLTVIRPDIAFNPLKYEGSNLMPTLRDLVGDLIPAGMFSGGD